MRLWNCYCRKCNKRKLFFGLYLKFVNIEWEKIWVENNVKCDIIFKL